MSFVLANGDSAEILGGALEFGGYEHRSIDAIVCDPPAGIALQGLAWDTHGGRTGFVRMVSGVFGAALPYLKPGAWVVAWSYPRTQHWTAWAMEDAGLQVHDCLTHLFDNGFGRGMHADRLLRRNGYDLAYLWEGWASKLRPGAENWILARKPVDHTLCHNAIRWGTGFLNLAACSVDGRLQPTNGMLSGTPAQLRAARAFPRFIHRNRVTRADRDRSNDHPTLKSQPLMRWLIRLTTRDRALVLDPFMGSGSTGVACAATGRRFLGIEQDAHHYRTAVRRVRKAYGA
jgi:site-specific DNA-methyltransferase (adenine-specific)